MSKGGEWEREIARILSEWGTGQRNPPQLWRSVNSGGWDQGRERHAGDLTANGPWGEWFLSMFVVEAKHRSEKETGFWYHFSRDSAPIWSWWVKVYKEATDCGRCPILIIKRNYYPPLIGFPENFVVQLPHYVTVGGTQEGVRLYHMEQFLETRTPEDIENGFKLWKTSTSSS